MKKKIKNKNLEDILSNAAQLGNCPMPGELALAVIAGRQNMKAAYDAYNLGCRQISESQCERDAQGRMLTVLQQDNQGNELPQLPKKLKFKDAATEAAAVEELNRLGETEAEVEVAEVHINVLTSLQNITPVQMETLTWLVEIVK